MRTKLIAGLLLSIVLIGAVVFWFKQDRANAPSIPPENAQDLPLTTEVTTITGEVICLPHKDTSGPQTLECAIGIKGDTGGNYALLSDDPTQTGTLPTGSKVEITGRLQEASPSSNYDTKGTLHVLSIKRL